MSLVLRWAGASDTGPVREGNEDSAYAGPRLALIADGVGGMTAGEVASAVALGAMRRLDEDTPEDVLDALGAALTAANTRLRDAVAADPSLEGMGTTMTALLWNGSELGLAHVGDSRAYLLRDDRLHRVTTDHTFVQTLVDEGRITEDEVRTHPHRSLILQALDGRTRIEPDLTRLELAAGDRFLLCSDGLSDVLRDDAVTGGLAVPDRQEAADGLVAAALRGGASDNVTAVVVDAVEVAEGVEGADTAAGHAAGRAPAPLVLGAAADPVLAERVAAIGSAPARTAPAGGGARTGPGSSGADVVDPEDVRYAPSPPRRLRWLSRALVAALVAAVVVAGGGAAYGWTQTQYFVTAHQGSVAIYRGIPQHVPGIRLATLYDEVDLPVAALPEYVRNRVQDGSVTADDLTQARAIVTNLEGLARRCPTAGTGPAPNPTTTSPGTAPASPAPTAVLSTTAVPTPTTVPTTPAGSPTPGATAAPSGCAGGFDLRTPAPTALDPSARPSATRTGSPASLGATVPAGTPSAATPRASTTTPNGPQVLGSAGPDRTTPTPGAAPAPSASRSPSPTRSPQATATPSPTSSVDPTVLASSPVTPSASRRSRPSPTRTPPTRPSPTRPSPTRTSPAHPSPTSPAHPSATRSSR